MEKSQRKKIDQRWSKPKGMSIHVSTRGELKGIWKIQNVLVMSRRYLVSDSVDFRMLNTNNVATKTHVAHTCWYEYGIRYKYTICKVYIKVFLTTLRPADVSFFVSVAQTRTPFPRSMSLLSCKFECKIWPLCCPRLTWLTWCWILYMICIWYVLCIDFQFVYYLIFCCVNIFMYACVFKAFIDCIFVSSVFILKIIFWNLPSTWSTRFPECFVSKLQLLLMVICRSVFELMNCVLQWWTSRFAFAAWSSCESRWLHSFNWYMTPWHTCRWFFEWNQKNQLVNMQKLRLLWSSIWKLIWQFWKRSTATLNLAALDGRFPLTNPETRVDVISFEHNPSEDQNVLTSLLQAPLSAFTAFWPKS